MTDFIISRELILKCLKSIARVLSHCRLVLRVKCRKALLRGDYDEAKKIALKYAEVLGKDNYFLEIQDHGLSEQKRIIPDMLRLSEETGIGLVATNDIHYLKKRGTQKYGCFDVYSNWKKKG